MWALCLQSESLAKKLVWISFPTWWSDTAVFVLNLKPISRVQHRFQKTISFEFKVIVCGLVGANIQLSISPSAPLITPYVRYGSCVFHLHLRPSPFEGEVIYRAVMIFATPHHNPLRSHRCMYLLRECGLCRLKYIHPQRKKKKKSTIARMLTKPEEVVFSMCFGSVVSANHHPSSDLHPRKLF